MICTPVMSVRLWLRRIPVLRVLYGGRIMYGDNRRAAGCTLLLHAVVVYVGQIHPWDTEAVLRRNRWLHKSPRHGARAEMTHPHVRLRRGGRLFTSFGASNTFQHPWSMCFSVSGETGRSLFTFISHNVGQEGLISNVVRTMNWTLTRV